MILLIHQEKRTREKTDSRQRTEGNESINGDTERSNEPSSEGIEHCAFYCEYAEEGVRYIYAVHNDKSGE